MVSTALHAAQRVRRRRARRVRVKSLERVLLDLLQAGAGVAHYFDGQPRVGGLLDDQFAMAAACLDAFDATGNIVYEMMAEELAHYAMRTMWDEAARRRSSIARASDGADAIGLMRRPLKPFATNCDAARTSSAASRARSGDSEFAARGRCATLARDGAARRRRRDRSPRTTCSRGRGRAARGDTLSTACHDRHDDIRCHSEERRHPAAHRFGPLDQRGGQRPSDDAACRRPRSSSTLFFGEMRYDPQNPQNPDNDRFVLSKGHAAPILYAAWAEAGLFPREELLKLRRIDSDLEGHPTPRLSFVDVATGSLGQGICAAIGTALNARRIGSEYRTYVLLGDGEMAEGSVWEAANVGAALQARQPVRASSTSTRSARARPRSSATTWTDCRALEGVRVAHDRRRRPRHPGAARAPTPKRARPRAGRR